jgi:hypothetical protein
VTGLAASPTFSAVSDTSSRRSPSTWWLLVLATAVTAMPVGSAVLSALRASGTIGVEVDPEDGSAGAFGFFDEQGLRVAEGISLLVTLPVAIACLVLLVGLAGRHEWAREGALGVFGLSGLLLLIFSLNGLTQEPPGRHADLGVLASLLVLGVAALALSPGVRGDFERKQIEKQVREREAATAARKARLGS